MGFWAYIITVVVTALAALSVAAVIVVKIARLIARQLKLYHSINLVELRSNKTVYWIFSGVVGVAIIYLVMQMSTDGTTARIFYALFGASRPLTNVALMFALILMIVTEVYLVALGLSRNAVVDKGIYTDIALLDYHLVHDYIIDEKRGILVLSADKDTFSTLKNLTVPFRVKKSDIPKLKFILNKNKNKFSDFVEV